MGRVVGATLVLLGVYVCVGLIRDGSRVRLRSRWMLLGDVARATGRAARTRARRLRSHRHPHDSGHHADVPAARIAARELVTVGAASEPALRGEHDHDHVHVVEDATSRRAAVGIGMLHGVGGETPTQVLLFITVAGVGGTATGMLLLLVFLAGLVISNTAIALVAGLGIGGSGRSPMVFAVLASITAAWSIVFGSLLLVGRGIGS
jgi:high-affinity nickel-transport protein